MTDFKRQGSVKIRVTTVMPFERDEDFVGREDIIKMIDESFSKSRSTRRVALVGLGGIGYEIIDLEYSAIL